MPGAPKGWIGCPPLPDHLIANKFLVFKTPYSKWDVPAKEKFTIQDVMSYINSLKKKFVCWIDLTNTSRYYDSSEVSCLGFNYHKLACVGHGTTPSNSEVENFIRLCRRFQKGDGIIGVHCTHGFNRTGFLICKYLMSELNYSAVDAINLFATSRPPGIYRQNYIHELCPANATVPKTPNTPSWVPRVESFNSLRGKRVATRDESNEARSSKAAKLSSPFYCDLPIISSVPSREEERIRHMISKLTGWYLHDLFAEPKQLMENNKSVLFDNFYAFKLKVFEGKRYILFIGGSNGVYFMDSDLNVFKAKLVFPMLDYHRQIGHLFNTIVIGDMVNCNPMKNTNHTGPEFSFIIDDILTIKGDYVAEAPFFERMKIIKGALIDSRRILGRNGRAIDFSSDVLSVEFELYHKLPLISSVMNDNRAVLPHKIVFYAIREPFALSRYSSTLEYVVVKSSAVFNIRLENEIFNLYCRDSSPETGAFSSIDLDSDSRAKIKDGDVVQCQFKEDRWNLIQKLDKDSLSVIVDLSATAQVTKDCDTKLTIQNLLKFLASKFEKT